MDENSSNNYLKETLKQLNISYNEEDQNDMRELESILMEKLCYPSTELAIFHRESNRLGTLDLREQKGDLTNKKDYKQSNMNKHKIKNCHCCTLPKQPSNINICKSVVDVKNVGISTRLFFLAFQHVAVMLFILFFVHSLYAIISNVQSCKYDAENLLQPYDLPRYLKLVNQWTFQVSLLSNISCLKSTKAYEIQCWLGVVFIVLLIGVVVAMKYRKLKACIVLGKIDKSIQNLTVLIHNLPATVMKNQLQKQLRDYQKSLNLTRKQDKKQINIVKINRVAPFYLSKNVFQDPKIKKVNKQYKTIKQKIIDLIKQRMEKNTFDLTQKQREQLYKQFQDIKKQRIQVYKSTVIQKIKAKKQEDKNKLVTSPAFVTFQSSFNRQFLLNYNENILNNKDNFYIRIPQIDIQIRAQIQKPPKPEQVIWTNLGQQKGAILKKKLIIIIISLIFLCGTCAGIYFLQKKNFEFALQNIGKTSTLYLSLLVSVIIVIVACVISGILFALVKKQRNITYMHEQQSLNNKIILAHIGNFLLVPIIFNLFFRTRFTGVVSLSQTVFFLSLQNAYVFPILKLLDPMHMTTKLRRYFANKPKNKLSLTQIELNHKFQNMQFNVGFQFAYSVRLVLFTCFFAPLQPIIVVFSISGIILMYWIQKYSLYYRCSRPIPGNRQVNISINKYLVFGPILFGVGCLIWPYYINQTFMGLTPSIIMIVISILQLLIPFQKIIDNILQKLRKKQYIQQKTQQMLYSKQKYNFKTQYDRLNYMTAHQAIHTYINQLTQQYNGSIWIKNKNIQNRHKKMVLGVSYVNALHGIIHGEGLYEKINQKDCKISNNHQTYHNLHIIRRTSQKQIKVKPDSQQQSNKNKQNKQNDTNNKNKQNNNKIQQQQLNNQNTQYQRLAQIQDITYNHQHNDNQILIQSIVKALRQYFSMSNNIPYTQSATNLLKNVIQMQLVKQKQIDNQQDNKDNDNDNGNNSKNKLGFNQQDINQDGGIGRQLGCCNSCMIF